MATIQTQNTPRTLDEVLAISDVETKIKYLKAGRRTEQPNTVQNRKDWLPTQHDIMDKEKYKQIRVLTQMKKTVSYEDANGQLHTTVEPAKYELKEPNRIALPIEQDIVNNFKERLKDPESFTVYSETYTKEDEHTVKWTLDYGAKNSFGGMVRETIKFKTCGGGLFME